MESDWSVLTALVQAPWAVALLPQPDWKLLLDLEVGVTAGFSGSPGVIHVSAPRYRDQL